MLAIAELNAAIAIPTVGTAARRSRGGRPSAYSVCRVIVIVMGTT